MNLNLLPTVLQLQSLIASVDDAAGHHILWVDTSGNVNVTQLPDGVTPVGYSEKNKNIRLRFETYCAGNGYVGLEASKDNEYIEELFKSLVTKWSDVANARPGEIFVD
jgi:hypothetical protein